MFDISKVRAAPSRDLLTPDNASTVGLAETARAFDVPVVLTTVAAESFSGPWVSCARRASSAPHVVG